MYSWNRYQRYSHEKFETNLNDDDWQNKCRQDLANGHKDQDARDYFGDEKNSLEDGSSFLNWLS